MNKSRSILVGLFTQHASKNEPPLLSGGKQTAALYFAPVREGMAAFLTCWQCEGHQVSEKIAGEVSLALVKRSGHLTADLLGQLGTHHGWDALSCLLGHLRRGRVRRGPSSVSDNLRVRARSQTAAVTRRTFLVDRSIRRLLKLREEPRV